MRLVGWFEIVIGISVAGLWTTLLATRQVPEIAEGRRDIWFQPADLTRVEALAAAVVVPARPGGRTHPNVQRLMTSPAYWFCGSTQVP